jgi:hypothetical protein
MQEDSTLDRPFSQTSMSEIATQVVRHLRQFLAPLLAELDDRIDKRLVGTFGGTIRAILEHRHRSSGLLLSELGGFLLSPDHAPAGTKRISNLLRCAKWTFESIARFLWQRADARRRDLIQQEETPYVVWDDSVNEKPESLKAEGLGPVRSSKAKRLSRIKPGYYRPPGPPVFVPGLNWLCLLILGRSGPPTVLGMEWWTTRKTEGGPEPQSGRTLRSGWLSALAHAWGRTVVHLFDRGYAGAPWLGELLRLNVRFVQRWPKGYYLVDAEEQQKKAWQISRGKRSWEHRYVRDARRNEDRKIGILAFRVSHPKQHPTARKPAELPESPLWLVVARSGIAGQEPWYLLTNEPIETAEDAWRVVMAYARRWQIEQTFRYNKSELAMESPRLWSWERRLKLLYMVTLAYAFLLSLLDPSLELLRKWLLRHYCHRTGKRSQDTPAPLYRLRSALSRLWQETPTSSYRPLAINSG